VEILSGKNVLGAAAAGAEGDFAIVLDDPLKPGDYQLVLRSTTPANIVAMSKETAVVSIPEHENGQVLALVESPGQPSKLITVPQPEKAAAAAAAPAAPATTKAPATSTATAGAPAMATAGSPQDATGAAPSGNTPAPQAGSGPAMASAGGASPRQAGVGDQTQTPATAQPDAGHAPATTVQAQISVEAVEIEGNKIFVAGIADPGSTVRVYANDAVLGEAKTSPVGRFLVESIHELAVGDYIIRADMLAADGLKVAARAAVPFTRAPGESVAAVASGEAGSGTAGKDAASEPVKPTADAGSAGAPANAGPAGTAAPADASNSMTAASGEPSAGAVAGAGSNDEKAQGAGTPQIVASNGQGATVLPSLDNDISRQPPTIVSPKLRETSGAVIIRRGDTLWQISRRVYGHGVRYSTIYLANQDQIEDPDLIWPGQIFAVPKQTAKGETANMKAIASQATEMPKKAVE
jgi:nucleoid-associated protein YgaU